MHITNMAGKEVDADAEVVSERASGGGGRSGYSEDRSTVSTLTAGQPSAEEGARAAAADAVTSPEARKVLIVDDNADAAEMMAMLLSSCGHEVQTAVDAESALRVANEFVPDVMLLDIGLPGIDGHTVARILRRDPRFRDSTLIALTGYGSTHDRERSIDAGFDHHLLKPAQVDQLLELIGQAAE